MQVTKTTRLPVARLSTAYRSDVKVFERWLNGRQVNAENIKSYFQEIEKTLSVSSIGRKKSALKKAIAEAKGKSLTLADSAQLTALFSEIKTGQADRAVHEHETLSLDELKGIIETAGAKTSAIIIALYETAARVSELLNIRFTDCEIRGEKVYCKIIRGKGKKERMAYMNKATFENLKKLYAGKTFLIEYAGKSLNRRTVGKMIKKAGKLSGRPDLHPHTLRHSKASHLLTGGMSLPAVSAYCGHSDPSITAKYYLHDKPTAEAVLGS